MRKPLSLSAICVLIFSLLLVPHVSAADATLSFDQESYEVYVNETVEVRILLDTSVLIGGLQFNVTWDPEYLELVSYANGSAISGAMNAINNGTGFIRVGSISISGIDSGEVLILTFKGKAKGNTTLFINIEDASDKEANPIEVIGDTANVEVKVNQLPVADFTFAPEEPWVGEEITFNASMSYDPDGFIVEYIWDFGDGTTLNTTSPIVTHAYSTGGMKNVTLSVVDNKGAVTTIVEPITLLSFALKLPDGEVRVNKTIELPIVLNTTEVLGGVQFVITFDPALVEVVNVTSDVGMVAANISEGYVEVGIISVSGLTSGEIAKLSIKGISNGTTELEGEIIQAVDITGSEERFGLMIPGELEIYKRKPGDANDDDRITVADALIYLRFAVGLDISPYHLDPQADDLTGDGRITVADALKVLRAAVGLETLE